MAILKIKEEDIKLLTAIKSSKAKLDMARELRSGMIERDSD